MSGLRWEAFLFGSRHSYKIQSTCVGQLIATYATLLSLCSYQLATSKSNSKRVNICKVGGRREALFNPHTCETYVRYILRNCNCRRYRREFREVMEDWQSPGHCLQHDQSYDVGGVYSSGSMASFEPPPRTLLHFLFLSLSRFAPALLLPLSLVVLPDTSCERTIYELLPWRCRGLRATTYARRWRLSHEQSSARTDTTSASELFLLLVYTCWNCNSVVAERQG